MLSRPKHLVILVFIIILSNAGSSSAQTNTIKYLSSFQSALGSNLSLIPGVYGALCNPGTIANTDENYAVLATTEQRFFLGSLNSTSLATIKKIGEYDYLGLSLGSFGIDEFKEQRLTLSYSKKIAENVSIGSTASYYTKSIEEYGSESDFDLNIGFMSKIKDDLELGAALYNIFSNENKGYLRENTEMVAGLRYLLSDKVKWLLEIRSDFKGYNVFSTGLSYQVVDQFNLQLGMNTLDSGISIGLSYSISSSLEMNASSRSNLNLGISPGLSIKYSNRD